MNKPSIKDYTGKDGNVDYESFHDELEDYESDRDIQRIYGARHASRPTDPPKRPY